MSIWQRLLYLIGLRPNPGPRTYEISESLQVTLSTFAQHEGRPEPYFVARCFLLDRLVKRGTMATTGMTSFRGNTLPGSA